MSASDVCSAAIRFLKDHLLARLRNSLPYISDDDIHWVLTVPAIWDDVAKVLMREAAEKVSIGVLMQRVYFSK